MKIFYTFQYHVAHFEPARMRNCKVCGKVFPAYRLTDKFCSIKCRNNHYVYNWRKSIYIGDSINFFNGFTGRNASGEVFQITNGGRGLSSLENYWRGLLAGYGAARVYFPGYYSSGAGLDCSGAPSGR